MFDAFVCLMPICAFTIYASMYFIGWHSACWLFPVGFVLVASLPKALECLIIMGSMFLLPLLVITLIDSSAFEGFCWKFCHITTLFLCPISMSQVLKSVFLTSFQHVDSMLQVFFLKSCFILVLF